MSHGFGDLVCSLCACVYFVSPTSVCALCVLSHPKTQLDVGNNTLDNKGVTRCEILLQSVQPCRLAPPVKKVHAAIIWPSRPLAIRHNSLTTQTHTSALHHKRCCV